MTPAKKAAPFARAERNALDTSGTVYVIVIRRDGSGRYVKGNISKTLTVPDAKVSAVAATIERALFGGSKK